MKLEAVLSTKRPGRVHLLMLLKNQKGQARNWEEGGGVWWLMSSVNVSHQMGGERLVRLGTLVTFVCLQTQLRDLAGLLGALSTKEQV